MQAGISALENQLFLKGAEQINKTIQDLQASNSTLKSQVATLQNKAKEVRVQVGFVSISSKEFPALGKPPSGCPEWTAGGHADYTNQQDELIFRNPLHLSQKSSWHFPQ